MKSLRFLLFSSVLALALAGYDYPNCNDKQVVVHLFDWSWGAIARECEEFLGPKGFCGVQVSPPMEHIQGGQWWTRYQPVSYVLESRSGNRNQFIDMVQRCNAVGVNVIADMVLNHMSGPGTGTGTGGNFYDGNNYGQSYPGVPYGPNDFHPYCDINNYNDPENVRNCYLVALNDLDGGSAWVRQKIADYANDLINIGVKGFRVDASKHMWPGDLEAMTAMWNDVGSERPFIYHEVINQGGEPITTDQYFSVGKVTEFRACNWLACIRDNSLGCLYNFGTAGDSSYTDGNFALTFVDNHDNQRGHGGGGGPLTYREAYNYKLATGFHLATDYGFKRVMSSFDFGSDTDQGPGGVDPTPVNNGDLSCGSNWVCEHRWSSIGNMIQFSNVVAGEPVSNWQDDGSSIAFSRGSKGFFAMGDLYKTYYTGMPQGSYCDIIHDCSQYIDVDASGYAYIQPAAPQDGDNLVAICQDCGCLGGSNLGCS